jgi:hypothetical protein
MTTQLLEREGSEFTHYEGFSIEYRAASHRYWLIRGQERFAAVSVTSALKVIDKPQLISWAERVGCEGALRMERSGSLVYPDGGHVPITEAIRMVRETGQGADGKKEAGANRGNALHDALRLYCELGSPPKIGDFDPEVRGYVQALCGWLVRDQPEPILIETIVGCPEHGFAGRFDLLATIDGRKVLADLKTSARPYLEQHLQLAAYLHALEECFPSDESVYADVAMLVLVGEDGSFTTHECRAEAKDFLNVLACHRSVGRIRNRLKSEASA